MYGIQDTDLALPTYASPRSLLLAIVLDLAPFKQLLHDGIYLALAVLRSCPKRVGRATGQYLPSGFYDVKRADDLQQIQSFGRVACTWSAFNEAVASERSPSPGAQESLC